MPDTVVKNRIRKPIDSLAINKEDLLKLLQVLHERTNFACEIECNHIESFIPAEKLEKSREDLRSCSPLKITITGYDGEELFGSIQEVFESLNMNFIQGQDRTQIHIFPVSLDATIDQDNEVRTIELFVNSLQLKDFGFRVDFPENGRPAYHPSDFLKLYIYGYLNKIRSSRDLEKECKKNIEVIWLLNSLQSDHNIISNFRRDNPEAINKVFRATVQIAKHFKLIGGRLLPVITQNVRHHPEITYLKNGTNGYITDEISVASLADKINYRCSNPNILEKFSQQAKNTFAAEAQIDNMLDGFLKAIKAVSKEKQ